jgi:hypothetical protein
MIDLSTTSSFLRNLHIDSQTSWASLHSHQQWTNALLLPLSLSLPPSLPPSLPCVCVCVCVCVCAHLQKLQVNHQSHPPSFEPGFLTELGDHRLPKGSSEILLLLLPVLGLKEGTDMPGFNAGGGLRSSYVHSKHSNDCSHSARQPLKNTLIKMEELDAQVALCCAVD